MSNAFLLTSEGNLPPEVATEYDADSGSAVPVANILNILGDTSVAGSLPVSTTGAGNTITTVVQISQALAAADATKVGLANFDSASFAVDADGFVTLNGGGFTWNDVSGAFSPLTNNGYFVTATATGTLPASPSQGDTIKFFVDTTDILTLQAAGTQIIRLGNTVSSSGGTCVSTDQGDSLELTYRASSDCWCTIAGASGNWTLS